MNHHTKKRKVLLLNPPGEKYYIRDCYCSTEAKGRYYWHPLDLLVQSGFLSRHFDVSVLDAVALDLEMEAGLNRILEIDPFAIFYVTGQLSWKKDLALLSAVKERTACLLAASGDLPRFSGNNLDRAWKIVDIVLDDFTSPGLTEYLLTGNSESTPGVSVPGRNSRFNSSFEEKEFDYPYPLHAAFPQKSYRLPFTSESPFASVLTTFGCNYHCKFCNVKALPFKTRILDGVVDEVQRLRDEQGIHTIFFRDPNIAAVRNHALELAERLSLLRFRISWNSYARVDCVDEELLQKLAYSGCSLLQFGLESGSDRILTETSKGFSVNQIRKTLEICRRTGIKTCGHFLLGVPGETPQEMQETLRFAASDLPLDFATFNIFEIRPGISDELINHPQNSDDNTGVQAKKLKRSALRKFYLRPKFVLRTIRSIISNPAEIKVLVGNIREFFRIILG